MALAFPTTGNFVGRTWPEVNPTHVCVYAGARARWRLYAAGVTLGSPVQGTQVRTGDGPPDNAVGVDGDHYINRLTGDWFTRASGVYAATGFNLKGPPGTSGGGGGAFQLAPDGVPGSELAPAVNAYSSYSTGITAGTDYLDFNAVANLGAAIKTAAGLKDNTLYTCSVEVFNYVQGGCELLIYGPTTGHLGISARFTANGTYEFPLTTNGATGTQLNQIRIRASGTGTHTFRVRISVREAATASAYPARAFDIIVRESPIVSICDAGVTPENSAATNYSNWQNLLATFGKRRWRIPEGEYDITALPIYWDAIIEGEGVNYSILNITGTGPLHGCDVRGPAVFDRKVAVYLSGFKLLKTGGAQTAAGTGPGQGNWSGLYVRTKCNIEDVTVEGFTNDGVYYAPFDADEATGAGGTIDKAPFFSRVTGLVARGNGRDGIVVRRGANAHIFSQIQAISNGRYGVAHLTDGFATYSNVWNIGQASYNGSIGWWFNNGTNNLTFGIYSEQNGCSTPGSNGTAYATTLIDTWIGDNCTDSDFVLGAIFGNDEATKLSHVRLPGFNPTRIKVREGGRLRYGTW